MVIPRYSPSESEVEEWEAESLEAEQAYLEQSEAKQSRQVPDVLDIKDAARFMGVSAKWLYRNYANIPHVLIGQGEKPRIKFRRSALEQWIANHEIDFRKRSKR